MVLELQFVGFGLMGFNLNPQAQPSLKLMKANHTSRPTHRPPTGFVVWLSFDLGCTMQWKKQPITDPKLKPISSTLQRERERCEYDGNQQKKMTRICVCTLM